MKGSLFFEAMADKICKYIGDIEELKKEIRRLEKLIRISDDEYIDMCEYCHRYIQYNDFMSCDNCQRVYCCNDEEFHDWKIFICRKCDLWFCPDCIRGENEDICHDCLVKELRERSGLYDAVRELLL
jgi:hypothetical protein